MKPVKLEITQKYNNNDIEDVFVVTLIEQRISAKVTIPNYEWGDCERSAEVYEYEYLGILELSDGTKTMTTISQETIDNSECVILEDNQ